MHRRSGIWQCYNRHKGQLHIRGKFGYRAAGSWRCGCRNQRQKLQQQQQQRICNISWYPGIMERNYSERGKTKMARESSKCHACFPSLFAVLCTHLSPFSLEKICKLNDPIGRVQEAYPFKKQKKTLCSPGASGYILYLVRT